MIDNRWKTLSYINLKKDVVLRLPHKPKELTRRSVLPGMYDNKFAYSHVISSKINIEGDLAAHHNKTVDSSRLSALSSWKVHFCF